MTLHRFTLFRLSRSLCVLLITLQVVACGSSSSLSSSPSSSPEQNPGAIANLIWIAPSEREDGRPLLLSEIAGYMVYFGNSTGDYPDYIEIMDSSSTQKSLSALLPGRYYLVITTIDTDGRESAFSEEVSITI